eukprot:9409-Eustigmatos_ZCMA.PRE.1
MAFGAGFDKNNNTLGIYTPACFQYPLTGYINSLRISSTARYSTGNTVSSSGGLGSSITVPSFASLSSTDDANTLYTYGSSFAISTVTPTVTASSTTVS